MCGVDHRFQAVLDRVPGSVVEHVDPDDCLPLLQNDESCLPRWRKRRGLRAWCDRGSCRWLVTAGPDDPTRLSAAGGQEQHDGDSQGECGDDGDVVHWFMPVPAVFIG
jgi:hypothetical protein